MVSTQAFIEHVASRIKKDLKDGDDEHEVSIHDVVSTRTNQYKQYHAALSKIDNAKESAKQVKEKVKADLAVAEASLKTANRDGDNEAKKAAQADVTRLKAEKKKADSAHRSASMVKIKGVDAEYKWKMSSEPSFLGVTVSDFTKEQVEALAAEIERVQEKARYGCNGCHPNNSSRCLWVMGLPKSSDDNEWEEKWRTVRSQFSSFVDFMALFQPDHWLTSMKGDHPSIFKTAKTIVPLLFEYLLTFLRCSACHHHCRQHQVDDGKLPWYMKSLGRPLPSVFEAFDFTPEEEKKNE